MPIHHFNGLSEGKQQAIFYTMDEAAYDDLNWFKTYAENDLADAREYLPAHDVESLILEVSDKVLPGDTRQILHLAEKNAGELLFTNVEMPVSEKDLNAFHLIRCRIQEVIIQHLRKRVEEAEG
jgi:hypothetical protein